MKKKYTASLQDKKDWADFTNKIENISIKEDDLPKEKQEILKIPKIDLHGHSLDDANKIVKKFIIDAFNKGCSKILIITGKGLHSSSYDDPYISKSLGVLKNSIPEYIKNDDNLKSLIIKIYDAEPKDGGGGAINIFLKKKKFTK